MTNELQKPAQDERGRFLPGNNGGKGRPKGSRNKLGEAFITALHDDFETHGVAAIATVRAEKPHEYLKVVASLLPKELKISTESDLSDAELDKRIRDIASAVSLVLGGAEAGTVEAPAGEAEKATAH